MKTLDMKAWPNPLSENFLLFNPKSTDQQQVFYRKAFADYLKETPGENLFALLTSGTSAVKSDDFKIIILKREAIESSAQSVNEWIQALPTDRWSLSLPSFHIGGLSILARAKLSQSEVIPYGDMKWDPEAFCHHLQQERISLVSLVPTQIHDLVQRKLPSPSNLRCVFVGGGELRADLWARAKELGWPMVLTFGMTEMSSQVACTQFGKEDRDLFLLPHVEAKMNSDRKLQLRSTAQLSARIEVSAGHQRVHHFQRHEWLQTEDYADLQKTERGTVLIPLGRGSDFVKIKGENVSLQRLRDLWTQLPQTEPSYLFAKPDTRDGHQIYVAVVGEISEALLSAQNQFNRKVLPFERIQKLVQVPEIPRSDLGKVLVSKILEMIK